MMRFLFISLNFQCVGMLRILLRIVTEISELPVGLLGHWDHFLLVRLVGNRLLRNKHDEPFMIVSIFIQCVCVGAEMCL